MKESHLWGLLLLFTAIAIIVMAPLSTPNYLPLTGDYPYHTVNIHAAMHSFLIAPGVAHDWFYPLFQFYAPFVYAVSGIIALLALLFFPTQRRAHDHSRH